MNIARTNLAGVQESAKTIFNALDVAQEVLKNCELLLAHPPPTNVLGAVRRHALASEKVLKEAENAKKIAPIGFKFSESLLKLLKDTKIIAEKKTVNKPEDAPERIIFNSTRSNRAGVGGKIQSEEI
jgi:hypothetical protein